MFIESVGPVQSDACQPGTPQTESRPRHCSRTNPRRAGCALPPSTFHLKIISQKVFVKSFCKSQFPHKFINLSFTTTNIKKKSTDLLRHCSRRTLRGAGSALPPTTFHVKSTVWAPFCSQAGHLPAPICTAHPGLSLSRSHTPSMST